MCAPNLNYNRFPTGSVNYYIPLIEAGYRIWVYSGDTDGAVPITGSLYWLNLLK